MLERGSYIPWASRFQTTSNQKRRQRKLASSKHLMMALMSLRNSFLKAQHTTIAKTVEGILKIYNLWLLAFGQGILETRLTFDVEELLQNKLIEKSFTNEFDQFVAEPGEALQFEKLVNASRAKKLEKSHDPLALVAHTGLSSRQTSSYYVTHPTFVVDYDDEVPAESELDELEKQNDLLKDQLLEASLKHDVELCVLINHECVDKILNVELEKVKKKSVEIQEGFGWTRIKILLEKLEDENVSLDFKVQSLIKERDNAKMEFKKLFDSIKKTRSQTQKEMDELIVHVSEKTYAYGVIRAGNQNLLSTISELKTSAFLCHDKCLAKHKLNVRSNVRRTFSTNSRTPKYLETTYVAPKTRFSKKETQSKTLDTTSVVSKSKIDVESASKAKDKVSTASRIKKTNLRDKPLSTFIKNKIRTSRIWQKWFESQPNVIWTPVNIKPNVANTRSSEKPSVSIKKWVVKLTSFPCVVSSCDVGYGDYIHWTYHYLSCRLCLRLICSQSGRDSYLYNISILDMALLRPFVSMSKATSTSHG
ncbi:hypothetical protein Tco_0327245 [Tanacetum coccineum]